METARLPPTRANPVLDVLDRAPSLCNTSITFQ
jgi:hypothetical protein